jgi:hypothetical protein
MGIIIFMRLDMLSPRCQPCLDGHGAFRVRLLRQYGCQKFRSAIPLKKQDYFQAPEQRRPAALQNERPFIIKKSPSLPRACVLAWA